MSPDDPSGDAGGSAGTSGVSEELAPPAAAPYFRGGAGSPVVLLHGITMSWRVWKPILPFLTGRHEVVAPTLAGHRGGPAPRAGTGHGVTAVVDRLCDQLDEIGIERAHLVGNSLGGWVALEMARRGRARSVIGLSPAGTWRARRDLARLVWMFRAGHTLLGNPRLSRLAHHPLLRAHTLGPMMARPERVPAGEVAELLADFADCALFAAILDGTAALHHLAEFDIAACPVTIAWGQKDRVLPYRRYGRPMRETVPGAEFRMLPGVGHVPMYDDPRLVARTILETTTTVDSAYRLPTAAPRKIRLLPRKTRRRAS
jgi:pimeloyl-ACP methyl ester carboxylesterase